MKIEVEKEEAKTDIKILQEEEIYWKTEYYKKTDKRSYGRTKC